MAAVRASSLMIVDPADNSIVYARTKGPLPPIGVQMLSPDTPQQLYNKNLTDLSNIVPATTLTINGTPATIPAPTTNGTIAMYSGPGTIIWGTFGDTLTGTNTVYGHEAGDSITSGLRNCAFGVRSLTSNTTGSDNTAIGSDAAATITGTSGITAVGVNAFRSAITPTFPLVPTHDNVVFGVNAMRYHHNNQFNVACGASALCGDSTVLQPVHFLCTAVGYRAIADATQVYRTSAFGTHTCIGMFECVDCCAIGNLALSCNPAFSNSPYSNCAFGSFALTTGSNANNTTANCALGFGALYDPPATLNGCTAVGYEALFNITTNFTTAFGFRAGKSLVDGFGTTLFGRSAATNSTSGLRNTCIGHNAAFAMTTANDTTIVGATAGANITTQHGNIGVGFGAGPSGAGIAGSISIGAGAEADASGRVALGSPGNPLATVSAVSGGAADAIAGDPAIYMVVRLNGATRRIPFWVAVPP